MPCPFLDYNWTVHYRRSVARAKNMDQAPLSGLKACVFDAYGTLFDFASAAKGCQDVLGDDVDPLTTLAGQAAAIYVVAGRPRPTRRFLQVTGDALDFALETLDLDKPDLRERLMTLYLTLDAFRKYPRS